MSEIRPRERRPVTGLSPVDRKLAMLEGEYYKLSEVAQIIGTSQSTLRRLLQIEELTAPSFEMTMGKSIVYLYTPTDVAELRDYLDSSARERKP